MNILEKINKKLHLILFFVFNILVFQKAISAYLSPDEAYTFLEYVYTKDILNIGLANNQILNTFLIYLTTNISIDEFSIRSPNVFFGILYFYYSYKFSLLFKHPLPYFIFMCSCPYLIDYFSIGRGHGISASLIFLALNRILFEEKYRLNNILITGFIFLLSSYSIHTTLIYFAFFYFFFKKNNIFVKAIPESLREYFKFISLTIIAFTAWFILKELISYRLFALDISWSVRGSFSLYIYSSKSIESDFSMTQMKKI